MYGNLSFWELRTSAQTKDLLFCLVIILRMCVRLCVLGALYRLPTTMKR